MPMYRRIGAIATTGMTADMSEIIPNQARINNHDAGGGGVADSAAHRFPTGVADVDRIDVRIAHHAADQADNAVGGEHARGRITIARRRGADDVVHRFNQIINSKWNGGDENCGEQFPIEAAEN